MNTKYVMTASAIVMGLMGLAVSFAPEEIANGMGLTSALLPTILLQIIGALYLGFAFLNWMSRKALIGGIYARPLCIGNFMHFAVAGLALVKVVKTNTDFKVILPITILYLVFAVLFGVLLFNNPKNLATKAK